MSIDRQSVSGQTCKDCVHFYITHDAAFPYGCKAMDFKSLRHPFLVVQDATGGDCQMWCAKGSNDLAEPNSD